MISTITTPTQKHTFLVDTAKTIFFVPEKQKKAQDTFYLKKPLGKMLSACKQSSYAYYNTEFQTMLEEGIEGIFEYNNLVPFFLRSGRETIFSAYTTDVDPYVSYF